MLVIPPCFNASVIVSHPNCINFEAYPGSIPFSTILLNESIEPVCKTPHKIVCSPIKSDLTSATKEDSNTPALSPPVATA